MPATTVRADFRPPRLWPLMASIAAITVVSWLLTDMPGAAAAAVAALLLIILLHDVMGSPVERVEVGDGVIAWRRHGRWSRATLDGREGTLTLRRVWLYNTSGGVGV